jgi:glutaredoxin
VSHYTVVSQLGCRPCEEAREFLHSKGERYVEVLHVNSNPWLLTLMKKAGLKTTPQVFSPEGVHIGGYDDLKRLLE